MSRRCLSCWVKTEGGRDRCFVCEPPARPLCAYHDANEFLIEFTGNDAPRTPWTEKQYNGDGLSADLWDILENTRDLFEEVAL